MICEIIFFRQIYYRVFPKKVSGTFSNYILNKSKAYTTGDRRSFMCRVKSNQSNKRFTYETNNQLKKLDYKVANFVGYIRSDLSSNLKYSETTAVMSSPTFNVNMRSMSSDGNSSSSSSNNFSSQSKINILLASPNANSNSNSSDLTRMLQQPSINSFTNTNMASTGVGGGEVYSSIMDQSMLLSYHSTTLLKNHSSPSGSSIRSPIESFNETSTSLHSSSAGASNGGGSNNSLTIQYYLVLHGQLRAKTEDTSLDKFVSRYDMDGKFIYIEPE